MNDKPVIELTDDELVRRILQYGRMSAIATALSASASMIAAVVSLIAALSIPTGSYRSQGAGIGTGTLTLGTTGTVSGTITMLGSTAGSLSLIASDSANNLTITQPLTVGVAGTAAGQIIVAGATSGGATLSTTATGSGLISSGDLFTNDASFLIRTQTTLANAASTNTATLTNAPTAGDPTKWISVDDNGTTRRIPAW